MGDVSTLVGDPRTSVSTACGNPEVIEDVIPNQVFGAGPSHGAGWLSVDPQEDVNMALLFSADWDKEIDMGSRSR